MNEMWFSSHIVAEQVQTGMVIPVCVAVERFELSPSVLSDVRPYTNSQKKRPFSPVAKKKEQRQFKVMSNGKLYPFTGPMAEQVTKKHY